MIENRLTANRRMDLVAGAGGIFGGLAVGLAGGMTGGGAEVGAPSDESAVAVALAQC